MTADIKVLKTEIDKCREDAEDMLRGVIDKRYDHVVVIGFKDGEVSINASRQASVIETLGYLTYAQQSIFSKWPQMVSE